MDYKKFEGIPTTIISDTLKGLNNMDPLIKPLRENYQVVGRALTAKISVGDNLYVLKAFESAKPGDVVVIDAKGDTYRAVAGDFMLGMAKTLGINGVVVDGVIRDIQGSRELNFPVFCKGTTVAASGKEGMGEINVTISCGGVPVEPGDIIVGDADGVVVIPQSIEEEIYMKSIKKIEKDSEREKKVAGDITAIREYINKMLSK